MSDLKKVIRQEYIKCAQDPVHFMKKYCMIQQDPFKDASAPPLPQQKQEPHQVRNKIIQLFNKGSEITPQQKQQLQNFNKKYNLPEQTKGMIDSLINPSQQKRNSKFKYGIPTAKQITNQNQRKKLTVMANVVNPQIPTATARMIKDHQKKYFDKYPMVKLEP